MAHFLCNTIKIIKENIIMEDNLVWTNVKSSFVEAVAYDEDNAELYVTLENGSYAYSGVPVRVFEGMLSASSKGTYYNQCVKDTYTFRTR
jgi:hypothetical protein